MSYRDWLETTPYARDEVRCFDAPNPEDAAKGVWGIECQTCLRVTYYRHAGEMSQQEAAALTMHLRGHDDDPLAEIRADQLGEREAPEPRESFPGYLPQVPV